MTTYTDPLRLRILKALTAALESVTPSNGYQNTLSGRVFRGRTVFGDDDQPPFVVILEAPQDVDQAPSPERATAAKTEWDLLIQGFTRDDRTHPSDPAHVLMADVRRALVRERQRGDMILASDPSYGLADGGGGSVVMDIRIGAGVVRPPDAQVSATAYFYLRVTLVVVEDLENPFA